MAFLEGSTTFEAPYVAFPNPPGRIKIGPYEVFNYITPFEMRTHIRRLAESVRLEDFETVLVNLNGGRFIFEWMAAIQGYRGKPETIEYHRKKGGYAAKIVKRVPEWAKERKVVVLDDIYDTGGVLREVVKDLAPTSQVAVLVAKKGIEKQIAIPNMTIGVWVDNVWLGGCGMNLGVRGEEDTFRQYPGLVVKLESVLT